ncbi:MAG: hypothetical protein H6735_27290 [Alphaproteobacteria bacterium]|nr:hypothetical protein [Alphaproteobacteria bacterium]
MDGVLRRLELGGYVRSADHDGLELAFPLPVFQERLTVLVGIALALAIPATLLGLGYPGAWFVERMGWWLVNEDVMSWRWLLYGSGVSAGLFTLWMMMRPVGVRMRVDRHEIEVRRSLRRKVTVRTADIATLLLDGSTLFLVKHDSRVVRLPELAISAGELGALRELIFANLPRRDEGDVADVPRDLSGVVRALDR